MRSIVLAFLLVVVMGSHAHAVANLPHTYQQFIDALLVEDAEALERILHPKYIHVTSSGKALTKEEFIGAVRAGKLRMDNVSASHVIVNKFGRITTASAVLKLSGQLLFGSYRGLQLSSVVLELSDMGEKIIFFQTTPQPEEK